jgi:hypothetical protein
MQSPADRPGRTSGGEVRLGTLKAAHPRRRCRIPVPDFLLLGSGIMVLPICRLAIMSQQAHAE